MLPQTLRRAGSDDTYRLRGTARTHTAQVFLARTWNRKNRFSCMEDSELLTMILFQNSIAGEQALL